RTLGARVLRTGQAGQQARRDLRGSQGDREVLQLIATAVEPLRRPNRLRSVVIGLAIASAVGSVSRAHDIPNERIDRSIQVSIQPGRIEIDYEVSLTELTLTQDLRSLIGNLPGAERPEWLARYGQVTGPLNKKGIHVSVDGLPVELKAGSFDLVVEEHP